MAGFHIAQVNIALPLEPLDAPLLVEFMAALEPVNARADAAPGFVWRLQTEEGDATAVRAFDDDRLVVNMTVWESLDALRDFAFRDPEHLAVMRRRREWFARLGERFTALWWVAASEVPSVADAEDRLGALRRDGPTPFAFTFQEPFPPPSGAVEVASDDRDLCPA